MTYKELYKFAEKTISKRKADGKKIIIVPVASIKTRLIEKITWLEGINIVPVDCKANDPYGHYECHGNGESRWEDPDAWTVLISYDNNSDQLNFCGQRFVWCKEMMHIFDTENGCVSSEEEYRGFLGEIELRPLDSSEMYDSENMAKWMALLLLCPKSHRDLLVEDWDNKKISAFDIALRFRIPESVVPALFSPYYEASYTKLILN